MSSGPRRDLTLDVIRGGCIVMMTFAHLATYTVVARVLHLPLWVDGASGFVLLSGLVLGLVQHGRLARGGLMGAEAALSRRAGVLYVGHLTVVGLAIVLTATSAVRTPWGDQIRGEGPARGLGHALLLRVNPAYLDILSLYVVLLALAMVAVPFLAKERVSVLACLVLLLYGVSQWQPTWTTLPTVTGRWEGFNWGAWQLLFLSGLVLGYHWRRWDLRRRLTSPRWAVGAAAVVAAVYAACIPVVYLGALPAVRPVVDRLLDKENAGPLWIVMAWAALGLAYALVDGVRRLSSRDFLRPLAVIGGRSLDSYLILSVVTVAAPVVMGRVLDGAAAVVLAGASLVVMVGWAALRTMLSARSRPSTSVDGQELTAPRVVQTRPLVVRSELLAPAPAPASPSVDH